MVHTRWMLVAAVVGCGGPPARAAHPGAGGAPLSLAADAQLIAIPAGRYVAGSTPEERATAYDDYQATAGTDVARERRWFEREEERHIARLPAFRIDLLPVTQAQYAEYVAAGHAPPPAIDEAAWQAQGFAQDHATEVARFVWQGGRPPPGREDHPVVLVTWAEAAGYCAWRGTLRHATRRLPTSAEYEKAARGEQGQAYPWGNTFEPARLNSAVGGPRDTVPVGSINEGASPFGVLDLAGNVFQWTATPARGEPGDQMLVKGSAWEDLGGLGRGAAGHGRPRTARHVIVGFRCAADAGT